MGDIVFEIICMFCTRVAFGNKNKGLSVDMLGGTYLF